LGPKAATEASSAKTACVGTGKAAISAAAPPPNGDGEFSGEGTSTSTAPQSWATARFTVLPTPPSM
jgi:hypothetical protein